MNAMGGLRLALMRQKQATGRKLSMVTPAEVTRRIGSSALPHHYVCGLSKVA
jgi:hypothetical protein